MPVTSKKRARGVYEFTLTCKIPNSSERQILYMASGEPWTASVVPVADDVTLYRVHVSYIPTVMGQCAEHNGRPVWHCLGCPCSFDSAYRLVEHASRFHFVAACKRIGVLAPEIWPTGYVKSNERKSRMPWRKEQFREALTLVAQGVPVREAAYRYGVSSQALSRLQEEESRVCMP